MQNVVVSRRPKLTEVATTRITDEWMQLIDAQTENRAEWFRGAIEAKLMQCDEFYFSHEALVNSTYTKNTPYTEKNTNVFKSLLGFFTNQRAQKKPNCYDQLDFLAIPNLSQE